MCYCYFKQSYWFQRYPVHVCIVFFYRNNYRWWYIEKMFIMDMLMNPANSSGRFLREMQQYKWSRGKSCRINALRSDDFMFREEQVILIGIHLVLQCISCLSSDSWTIIITKIKNMLLAARGGCCHRRKERGSHKVCFPPILDVKNVKIFCFIFQSDSVYLFLGARNSEFKLSFIHYRNFSWEMITSE